MGWGGRVLGEVKTVTFPLDMRLISTVKSSQVDKSLSLLLVVGVNELK